jgi:hypothetical protein
MILEKKLLFLGFCLSKFITNEKIVSIESLPFAGFKKISQKIENWISAAPYMYARVNLFF